MNHNTEHTAARQLGQAAAAHGWTPCEAERRAREQFSTQVSVDRTLRAYFEQVERG